MLGSYYTLALQLEQSAGVYAAWKTNTRHFMSRTSRNNILRLQPSTEAAGAARRFRGPGTPKKAKPALYQDA